MTLAAQALGSMALGLVDKLAAALQSYLVSLQEVLVQPLLDLAPRHSPLSALLGLATVSLAWLRPRYGQSRLLAH